MARGMLGKSRSPPQGQGISKPYLRYTDAVPRDDLQEIQHGVSYSRPIHQVVKSSQRTGTPEQRNTDSPAPKFDFRVTSPAEGSNTHLGVDESMIGIALGSPRLLETHNAATRPRIPPPAPSKGQSSPLHRKSSKWRKIGGLFKAKNAIAPPANKPFYQVRPAYEGPSQDSTHSVDYRSRGRANKSGPMENTEVWPCLASENEALDRQKDSKPAPGLFLQVEIPQVEMERYSVMFDGLLNKGPSLLNRRSRTLDNLTIPGKEEHPGAPQRRATSPVPSMSPSFKLFPTMPSSKAAKILGTNNLSRAPDRLRKSQGSVDLNSPARTSSQATLTPDFRSRTQLAHHRPHASVTSFLSATTIGSDDEGLLIHKIEPVRTFAGMKEPAWKVVHNTESTEHQTSQSTKDLSLDRNLTINTRELGSDSGSISSTEASSPILSPLSTTTAGSFVFPPRNESITFCPPPRTSSRAEALQPTTPTPNHQNQSSQSQDSTPQNGQDQNDQKHDSTQSIPQIEVSIARSVSVSRGKKQIIVPVRTRAGAVAAASVTGTHSNLSHERLVARQAKTPQVTGPAMGHRPRLSQDVRIEMVQ